MEISVLQKSTITLLRQILRSPEYKNFERWSHRQFLQLAATEMFLKGNLEIESFLSDVHTALSKKTAGKMPMAEEG
jgi:hypothetical protein